MATRDYVGSRPRRRAGGRNTKKAAPRRFPVIPALLAGALLALLALPLSGRACAALLLLATVVHLSLLNQAPTSPYFAHTLQLWEQGRFLRFYGLSQWLGWLWPYAVLVVVLLRLSHREGQTYNPSP